MIDIDFGPARLSLLPGRAVYWAQHSALLLADTHFGKASVFRTQGLAVPDGDTEQDMRRIDALVARLAITRVIILGDIVHGAVSPELAAQLMEWIATLAKTDVRVNLLAGNHDRALAGQTKQLGATIAAVEDLGGLRLTHDAPEDTRAWTVSGHIHPVMSVGGHGPDRLRMPVFWQRQRRLVLPSFGAFTGGHAIKPARSDRIWLAGDDAVMAYGQHA